jgi:S-methylmethionine-dependent homocysteine/selenocysteine methylase
MSSIQLPNNSHEQFMTDGGLETTMIFHHGIDLPYFASFTMLNNSEQRLTLANYYSDYLKVAEKNNLVMLLDTPTWRANPDWIGKLGLDTTQTRQVNIDSVQFVKDIQVLHPKSKSLINGVIGPRGDGYNPQHKMSVEQARDYHRIQIEAFHNAGADMITAVTMNYPEEAIGMSLAAKEFAIPIAISFTTETDGKLPSGEELKLAIFATDDLTDNYPIYFMINCAHPTHFNGVLNGDEEWVQRIKGLRVNASCKSHAELDESEHLDDGNPSELASQVNEIKEKFPQINILGGCCGTDIRHITEMFRGYTV